MSTRALPVDLARPSGHGGTRMVEPYLAHTPVQVWHRRPLGHRRPFLPLL